jgi:alkylation response protein AidB-like acyl-CoA dehydrogenase
VDFDLTDAQKALRDKARAISLSDLAPAAGDIDREQRFPQHAIKRLAELGMLGIAVPKAWGGAGADHLSCALVIEELASGCASTALIVSMQNLLVCEPIVRFGSDEQKLRWLPALATGTKLGCFAFSEADGAQAARGMGTMARREGDGWSLQGTKSYVTAGPVAQCALVFAATASGTEPSLSAFLVPTDMPGISFGPAYSKLGLRGAVAASMTLSNVKLSSSALLGAEGQGHEVLRLAVEGSRIGAAALSVGIARAAFASATQYAISRQSNGQAIAEHQTIQFALAEMSTQIDAARLLTWRAANCRDVGGTMGAQASMAKLVACEAAARVSTDAVEVLGGNGCLTDYAVERHFRDAKVAEIYEGTNDIQRLGIASVLLKD